jgi:hypothetical protein
MLDFPNIEAPAAAPAPRTEVATAAAQALDLAKIDLAAVVRQQFGDWRAATAQLKADNAKTVLDLTTQSRVDEARSLRERTINKPIAEARKTCKALKSTLASASKVAGDEVDALVLAYEEAAAPITKQIDEAQARFDAAKAEKERLEREAQERHAARLQVIAGYLLRCQEVGMTAERIALGIKTLADSDVSDTDAARAEALAGAKARALEQMGTLHAQAVAREAEAARQEAIRVENERRAAELAEQERRIAAEAAAIRKAAEELAAREAAARAAEAAAKQAENDRLAALDLKRAAELQAEFEASCAAATAREKAAQERYIEDRQADPIRADDPDAAPHTTAAEMGGDRADPGEAVGLAEVNPEPATVKESLTAEPTPADTLRALAAEARASRVPTNPKMGPEWWARWFAAVDALEVA